MERTPYLNHINKYIVKLGLSIWNLEWKLFKTNKTLIYKYIFKLQNLHEGGKKLN